MDYKQESGKHGAVLLTGGHGATTGMAVIQEIQKRSPEAKIFWIGSDSVVSGSNVTSVEYKTYPSMGVKYFSIKAGKLQTKFTRYTIPLLLSIPIGFIQALGLLIKIKPKVILSFGGSASLPVVFWGWVFRVPVILHEQTVAAGRASMLSAFFADKIVLGRVESMPYFPKDKCTVTGIPLRSEIAALKPKRSLGKTKTLLIMGGSRGSEFINEEVSKIRPMLLTKYKVIHITGERDYSKYKPSETVNYRVLPFVNSIDMAQVYSEADVIVSRAGANSVAEILYIKRPSILIPLPRTYLKEQVKNAEYVRNIGLASVLTEAEVSSGVLHSIINKTFQDWQKIVDHTSGYQSLDSDSSRKVVSMIFQYLV